VEDNLWCIEKGITKSADNLCLHLIGNLQTYIGAEIEKKGYICNCELEFSAKGIPQNILLERITDTRNVIQKSLSLLTDEGRKSLSTIPHT